MIEGMRRDAAHVAWPGLQRVPRGGGAFSLFQPAHGTSLDVEEESAELVNAILVGFTSPTTIDSFLADEPDVPDELVRLMVRSGFVVAVDELPFLEHGFLQPTATPAGDVWSWSDLPELATEDAWVVVGVPVDLGALGPGGARHGPSEIRKRISAPLLRGEGDVIDAELRRRYPALRPVIGDLGDVDPEGMRMDYVGARLAKIVRELLAHGMKPLILGGDHALTHYVLAEAISRGERFGILHFDAHHDLTPSPSLSHANVFRVAIDSPCVTQLVQIGLRVIERMPPYAVQRACSKRTIVTAREAMRGEALEVLARLPRDIPYYLTFDVDCLDATIVRETGTPELGGLDVACAVELIDYIARTFRLLGVDFVEVAAPQGPFNAAAAIAASLLSRCVIGASPFEPLSNDVYELARGSG
jgi:arginase family enzyme